MRPSSGIFLLAKLHVNALATKRTPKAVQEALHHLPASIDDTYNQAMQRIQAQNEDSREIAMLVLLWTSSSTRPLNVREIEHACSVNFHSREVEPDAIDTASEMVSLCTGLVTIDTSKVVRLVHFSAQDYFEQHREAWFPGGHSALGQTCLGYLTMEVFDAGPCASASSFAARSEEYHLLDYASCCWGIHAAAAKQTDHDIEKTTRFLKNRAHRNPAVQALFYSRNFLATDWNGSAAAEAPHLVAYFGLTTISAYLLSAVDCQNAVGTTPLMYAAQMGHTSVVQYLFGKGADPNIFYSSDTSALHRAIHYRKLDTTKALLDHPGTDVNLRNIAAISPIRHR